jgi:RimJ/RimL family protein N-acetyltransferase
MDVKNYSAVEKLKDGNEVAIRAVRAEDKVGFARGFEQLSGEAIYRRFFSRKKQLTEEELKIATEIDFVRVVALVAEIEEDGEKKLIGACRYVAIDDNDPPRHAEIAFTVLDAWQGKGLGQILFRHLSDIGRACGVEKFEAVVLSENRGMVNVFTGSGLQVNTKSEEGEIHFDIRLNG